MKNMKRIAVLVLAALLCLCGTGLAESETDGDLPQEDSVREVTVLDWANVQNALFVPIPGVKLKIYMPYFLEEIELTDEAREHGVVAYYVYDPEAPDIGLQAALFPTECEDVLDYEEYVKAQGVTDTEFALVNEIPALIYRLPEEDSVCLAIMVEGPEILELTFWPASDESLSEIFEIMMASVQVIEEEAEEPET